MSYYIEDDPTIIFMLNKIKEWKYSKDDILLLQVDNYEKYIKKEIDKILDMVKKDPKSPFNEPYINCVKIVLGRLEEAKSK